MADFEELSFSYHGLLSNAHHDGTTQQIDDCCGNFETENQVFLRKAQTLHQCRAKEDRGLEEVAGGSCGEAAAGCGQAAGQLHVLLPQHRERLRFPA